MPRTINMLKRADLEQISSVDTSATRSIEPQLSTSSRPGFIASFIDRILCCTYASNEEPPEVTCKKTKKAIKDYFAVHPYASTPILVPRYRPDDECQDQLEAVFLRHEDEKRRPKNRKRCSPFRRSSFQGDFYDLRVTHPLSPVPSCDTASTDSNSENSFSMDDDRIPEPESYDSSIVRVLGDKDLLWTEDADVSIPSGRRGVGAGIFSRGNSLISDVESNSSAFMDPTDMASDIAELLKATPITNVKSENTSYEASSSEKNDVESTVKPFLLDDADVGAGPESVVHPRVLRTVENNMSAIQKWSTSSTNTATTISSFSDPADQTTDDEKLNISQNGKHAPIRIVLKDLELLESIGRAA
jgi:hypothetical protein